MSGRASSLWPPCVGEAIRPLSMRPPRRPSVAPRARVISTQPVGAWRRKSEVRARSARKPCLVGGAAERARNGGAWEKRGEGIGNQRGGGGAEAPAEGGGGAFGAVSCAGARATPIAMLAGAESNRAAARVLHIQTVQGPLSMIPLLANHYILEEAKNYMSVHGEK
ncbi:unnamed protein product [Prorocentrum cordatum]|uniref:Uncharacterized protein n=1 Tax=Prorocentrum cordatum TaxID=2364126 RepID=A0ABN9UU56_9DINO|nr:unnamed protein product [Polarella glacialis]